MKHFNIVLCFLVFFFLTQFVFSQIIVNNQKIIKTIIEKTKQIVFSKLNISKFGLIFVKNNSLVVKNALNLYKLHYFFDVIDSKNKNKNKLGCIGFAYFFNDIDAIIRGIYFFMFKCDNIFVACNYNFTSTLDQGCK